MLCYNCYGNIDDITIFCEHCGSKIKDEDQEIGSQKYENGTVNYLPGLKQSNNENKEIYDPLNKYPGFRWGMNSLYILGFLQILHGILATLALKASPQITLYFSIVSPLFYVFGVANIASAYHHSRNGRQWRIASFIIIILESMLISQTYLSFWFVSFFFPFNVDSVNWLYLIIGPFFTLINIYLIFLCLFIATSIYGLFADTFGNITYGR